MSTPLNFFLKQLFHDLHTYEWCAWKNPKKERWCSDDEHERYFLVKFSYRLNQLFQIILSIAKAFHTQIFWAFLIEAQIKSVENSSYSKEKIKFAQSPVLKSFSDQHFTQIK